MIPTPVMNSMTPVQQVAAMPLTLPANQMTHSMPTPATAGTPPAEASPASKVGDSDPMIGIVLRTVLETVTTLHRGGALCTSTVKESDASEVKNVSVSKVRKEKGKRKMASKGKKTLGKESMPTVAAPPPIYMIQPQLIATGASTKPPPPEYKPPPQWQPEVEPKGPSY